MNDVISYMATQHAPMHAIAPLTRSDRAPQYIGFTTSVYQAAILAVRRMAVKPSTSCHVLRYSLHSIHKSVAHVQNCSVYHTYFTS